MLTQISPRLGRFNVVSNSFTSRISNASEEFSRAPEMPLCEIIPQPGMLMQKLEGGIALEQLQSSANTHGCWHLNKQVDMVNSDMQFIDFESMPVCNLSDKKLTVHPDSIKLHGVSGILALPNKVEGILPERMFSTCQIHFFAPQTFIRNKVLTMFVSLIHGDRNNPHNSTISQELNFTGGRIPPMLESIGILRQK